MDIFWILLILLGLARLAGALSSHLGQPALVGELLAGVLLGVALGPLHDVAPFLAELPEHEVLRFLSDLGIFFLMLLAGVELSPKELLRASSGGAVIGGIGFLLPLGLGFGAGFLLLPDSDEQFGQALFLGTALAATAVPVTVKVLLDLGQLNTRFGRTIVSAAAFDDVLTLLLLAALTSVMEAGALPGGMELLALAGRVMLFFGAAAFIGRVVYPHFGRLLVRSRVTELELSGLMVMALLFAVGAELLGMHFLLGPFLAGVFWVRSTTDQPTFGEVKARVEGLTFGIFAPVFFASVGLSVDLGALHAAPLLVALVLVAACVGKALGTSLPAYFLGFSARRSFALGAAMNARGAVELIIADVALRAGLFRTPEDVFVQNIFSATVIMAVATTLMAPPLMRWLLQTGEESERAEEAPGGAATNAARR